MRASSLAVCLALGALCAAACTKTDDPDGGPISATCAATSECSGGNVCVVDTCRPPGTIQGNGACGATRDCASGLYCEPLMGKCMAGGSGITGSACADDAQCLPGLRCETNGIAGVCTNGGSVELGESCVRSSECLAGLYCALGGSCQPFKTAFNPQSSLNCVAEPTFRSFFEVPRTGLPRDFFRLPYPNDIRVSTTQKLDLSDLPRAGATILGVDLVDLYADTLVEDFDGFSTMGQVYFRFSQPIDFGFFDANALAGAKFVDLTTGEPLLAIGYGFGGPRGRFMCENVLTVGAQPTTAPLVAGHTYGVVLTTAAVRAMAGGAAPAQDADLTAVLGASRPGDAALGKAWDDYAKLRAWLPTEGITTAQVVNAAVFTVADPTATMKKLAAATLAQPAPVLSSLFQCGGAGTDPCDDGTAARRCGGDDPDFVEIHGKIKLPIFQSGTAPYLKPADGGAINVVSGTVTKVRDEEVCFALTIPKGTAPTAGWPLVVYGHGTGGSFRSFIADGVAGKLAQSTPRMAVFSIDAVGHGARRGASTTSPDQLVFNVANPRAARDNFLQGAADVITALRLPAATVAGAWSGPALKFPATVAYFGHSQGATHGSLALPFTDAAGAYVMSGAGANLSVSVLAKTSPSSYAAALRLVLLENVDAQHPILALWQNFFDRADPANYAPLLLRAPATGHMPKHLLMTWGKGDTYTPGGALKSMAVITGLAATAPIIEDLGDVPDEKDLVPRPITRTHGNVTAVYVQYQPSGYDGHFVAWRNPSALGDVAAFLGSYFATGTPIIP